MTPDPLEHFRQWLADAKGAGLRVPHAAVLSTIGLDGAPNARSVAVKSVDADGVVVSGPLVSRKGHELAADPRCALTLWWDKLGRQVRIHGVATLLDRDRAQAIWIARPREARIVATVSDQGKPLEPGELDASYAAATDSDPAMPDTWGGWVISPQRLEFMEFSDARFHARTLFERVEGVWSHSTLQP